MPSSMLHDWVDVVRSLELLTEKQAEAFARLEETHGDDPKALLQQAAHQGVLSTYQAKKILGGRIRDLRLGDYILIEKVGEGGMGKVYRARDTRDNRTVALKILNPKLVDNPIILRRFQREGAATASLNHPNIVQVRDIGAIGRNQFLAMEFVRGIDLFQLVRRDGLLGHAAAYSFLLQAGLGLQHAHDHGLIHRDIKPSNLMMLYGGKRGDHADCQLKLLDLGLARLIADSEEEMTALTQMGVVIGTPDYMAPEQARDSRAVEPRTDLYSLGCSFYFLLSGQVPFPGGTSLDKLIRHQTETPADLQFIRNDIPDPLAQIIRKLMAKRPDDRFPDGEALAAAVERYAPPLAAGKSTIHRASTNVAPVYELDDAPTRPTKETNNDLNVSAAKRTHAGRRSSTEVGARPPRRRRRRWRWFAVLLLIAAAGVGGFVLAKRLM